MEYPGTYYFTKSSEACSAVIKIDGEIVKVISTDDVVLIQADKNSTKKNLPIPGIPSAIEFLDGSSFVPINESIRWSSDSYISIIIEKIANNVKAFSFILICIPIILWSLIFVVMPNISEYVANQVPENSKTLISKTVLEQFSKTYFVKSGIAEDNKKEIEIYFFESLKRLDLNKNKYELLFYKADFLGANAFALPDGTIILTDDMVLLLIDHPEALLSVLLHEVGHVENNHSLKQITRSLGIGLIFTYITGDAQGLTEIITGTGLGLLQASFSREMEVEADIFSLNSLNKIGISKERFIFAMKKFTSNTDSEAENNLYLEYLSSHPHIDKRIELLNKYE